jgi:hypothetical protein
MNFKLMPELWDQSCEGCMWRGSDSCPKEVFKCELEYTVPIIDAPQFIEEYNVLRTKIRMGIIEGDE